MADKKYDIFISYRRVGGAQYARILQLMLSQRGYKVFLDYDELTDGIFGDHIKAAIKEAPVFMLVLSEKAMERCVNKDDWVRQEIELAIKEDKHFIPVNPDNSFDGVPEGVPEEIKAVATSHQQSEIGFGQTLGVTIDLLIKNRLVPTLGERKCLEHIDTDYNSAVETLKRIDAHNRFMKRLGITAVVASLMIAIGSSALFWHRSLKKESLTELRTELEKKYSDFHLYLNDDLSLAQMNTIDDILEKMVPVRPDTLWMSQFEFTIGQWCGITGENYDESQKDLPMTGRSYGEIYDFIFDLKDVTNISFDLPSVAEWEYAARSGSYHDSTLYAGNDAVESVAWYKGNSGGIIHPSNGQQDKWPNKLDLYDMSGNVSELCNNPFVSGADNASYTICGGDYTSTAEEVTVSSRKGIDTNARSKSMGFRLIIRK